MNNKLLSIGGAETISRGFNWCTFLFIPFLTSPDIFGEIVVLNSLLLLLLPFSSFGQDRVLLKTYGASKNLIEIDYSRQIILISSVVLFIIIGSGSYFIESSFIDFVDVILIFFIILMHSINKILLSVFRVEGMYREYIKVRYVYSFIRFFSIILFVKLDFGFHSVIYSELFALICSLILMFIQKSELFYLRLSILSTDLTLLSSAALLGWPLIFHMLGTVIISQSDRLMIASMLDNSNAAVYTFTYTFFSAVSFIYGALTVYYEPILQKSSDVFIAIKIANKQFNLMIACGIAAMFFIWVTYIVIIENFKSDYFIDYVSPVLICFAHLLLPFYIKSNHLLLYLGDTSSMAKITLSAAFVNVILNIIFIPFFGVLGAALSTFVAYFLMVILYKLALKKSLFRHLELMIN